MKSKTFSVSGIRAKALQRARRAKFRYENLEARRVLSASGLLANGTFEATGDFRGLEVDTEVAGWSALANADGDQLLDVVPRDDGNIIRVDAQAGHHDGIYQNVDVIAGQTYLLSFNLFGPGEGGDRTDQISAYWNNELLGHFRGTRFQQTFSIEIAPTESGSGRLSFTESFSDAGGDGIRGPFLDDISLRPVSKQPFENGGFETGDRDPQNSRTPILNVPNWHTDGPFLERTASIRKYNNSDPIRGDYYWNADTTDRYDRLFHSFETEADKNYVLTFDMRSPDASVDEGNQLRVRWNGKWAATRIPTPIWQTYSVELSGEKNGTSWLDLREALTDPVDLGDGIGPWIDNVQIYEVDSPTVVEFSPRNGEEMVNVTRESIVRFDTEVDPDTVDENSFYVIANSQTVPGRVVVSSTNRFATYFYDEPLPDATEVRIVLDGNSITDTLGLPIDADGDGVSGGVGQADFSTLPLTRIPDTNVFGYVRDSVSGDPLEGVTIRVDAFPGLEAVTTADDPLTLDVDESGRFELTDVPAPEFFVTIDGSTVTNTPEDFVYPTLGKPFHSVPGQTVQLSKNGEAFDIYLPLMGLEDIQELSDSAATDVGFGDAGKVELAKMFPNVDPAMFEMMKVTFEPGSARDDFGNEATQAVVVPVASDRIPAPLPPFIDSPLVISIQAGIDGNFNSAGGATNFDVPAAVSFPNLEGLAPGEKTLIFSFDHDAGEWIVNGTGTVSADGMAIVSDAGTGILAPGWHATNEGTEDDNDTDDDPDEDEEDEEEEYEYEITVSLGADVEYQPLTLEYSAGLTLPGEIFGADGLDQPLAWNDSVNIPDKPYTADFGASFTFRVSEFAAKFIPSVGPIKLFGAEFSASISAGLGLEGVYDITGGENEVELEMMTIRPGNVEASGSFKITDSYLCSIPFDIGEKICQAHSTPPLTLLGLPSVDLPSITLPLPFTAVLDRVNDPFQLGFFASASTSLKIAPTVGISKKKVEKESNKAFTGFANDDLTFVADAASLASNDTIYYRYVADTGFNIAGSVSGSERISEILPPNSELTLYTYSPHTNRSEAIGIVTGRSGTSSQRELVFSNFGGFDNDQDGIPNVGEFVIGTDLENVDSDGDGVSDRSELEQGLNPLDGIIASTGVVAGLDFDSDPTAVAVAGDQVFVTVGNTLSFVDSSQFDQPVTQGQAQLSGAASDIVVDELRNIAVAATGLGVDFIDYSDPMMPVKLKTVSAFADKLEIYNGFVYAFSGGKVRTIDVATQSVTSTIDLGATGSTTGVSRIGDKLYAYVSGSDTLVSLDLSTAEQPRLLDSLGVNIASSDVGIFAGNDVLWLAGSGLRTVDISDPTDLEIIQEPSAGQFFTASQIALNGSGLGVLVPDGGNFVQIYDTSDPMNVASLVTQFDFGGNVRDLKISRGLGFVVAGNRLEIFNPQPFDAQGVAPTVDIVSPVADFDDMTEGVQVLEGTRIPISALTTDDVQVREVELLINGEVVGRDVSFPFDLATIAPNLAEGVSVLDVTVRATDTGGNTTVSDSFVIDVVPDTIAPNIVAITPAAGGEILEGDQTIRIRFDEALSDESANDNLFKIAWAGPDGQFATGDEVVLPVKTELRDDNHLVQVSADDLRPGLYRMVVRQDAITDRAGNALGVDPLSHVFNVVEATPIFEGESPDIVFVVDVSGSTSSGFGGTPVGDLNNDGQSNDILDAELAWLTVLNQEIANLGIDSEVGIVAFGSSGAALDMNPSANEIDFLIPPFVDQDDSGRDDFGEVASTITRGTAGVGFGTNFELALQAAIDIFEAEGTAPGEGNIIFLSDGSGSGSFSDEVSYIVNDLQASIRAFGVGAGAQLNQLTQMDPDATIFESTDEFVNFVLTGTTDDEV